MQRFLSLFLAFLLLYSVPALAQSEGPGEKAHHGNFPVTYMGSVVLKISQASTLGDVNVSTSNFSDTIFGFDAAKNTSCTGDSVYIGNEAGKNMSGGQCYYQTSNFANIGNVMRNTIVGAGALRGATGGAGACTQNIGAGGQNVAIGDNSLGVLSCGNGNVAMGTQAGNHLTTGNSNVCLGGDACLNLTTGTNNVCVGNDCNSDTAGATTNTASNNTTVGANSNMLTTSGANNTSVGYQSGGFTSGSNNIALGASIAVASGTASNQMNIGGVLTATGINTPSTSISDLPGKVILGGATDLLGDSAKLAVEGAPTTPNGDFQAQLTIMDTTNQAVGTGGCLGLAGYRDAGTTSADAVALCASKTNNSSGNTSFNANVITRTNGSAPAKIFTWDNLGHWIVSIGNATAPTCGTGCTSITSGSTDTRGSLTTSSAVTSITLNFGQTLTSTPYCVVAQDGAAISAVAIGAVPSTTTLVITTASAVTSKNITWICIQ